MPNPYGIEQVDVPGAIAAYRSGRQDRTNQLMEGMKLQQMQTSLNHSAAILALSRQISDRVGHVGGSGMPAAVAAYDAPPAGASPQVGGPAPISAPSGMAGAYAPSRSPAVDASAPAPTAAAPLAPAASGGVKSLLVRPRSSVADNADLLSQLAVLEPEHVKGMTDAFSTMDKASIDAAHARNSAIGLAAEQLLHLPVNQRAQVLRDEIGPDLLRHGVSPEMVQEASQDLSDNKLTSYVQQTRDIEKVIEGHRLDRNTDSEIAYRADEIGVRRDANDITERNNIRTNATSSANNVRTNSTSSANNVRTNTTSAANNTRSTTATLSNRQNTPAATGVDANGNTVLVYPDNRVVTTTGIRPASSARARGRLGGGGGGAAAVAKMPDGTPIVVRGGRWVNARTGAPVQ